jgi:hypothetical protein
MNLDCDAAGLQTHSTAADDGCDEIRAVIDFAVGGTGRVDFLSWNSVLSQVIAIDRSSPRWPGLRLIELV